MEGFYSVRVVSNSEETTIKLYDTKDEAIAKARSVHEIHGVKTKVMFFEPSLIEVGAVTVWESEDPPTEDE